MKLITAILRPEKLDEVIDAVRGNNGRGLTVTEVRGFGQQFGLRAVNAITEGLPRHPRAVLLTEAMVDAIAKQAHTAVIGDGKIWVSDVDSVLRIRTGEKDREAV